MPEEVKKIITKRNKKYLVVILIVICIFAAGLFWINSLRGSKDSSSVQVCYINPSLEVKNVQVGQLDLSSEIAASSDDQQQGLSDRDCLGDDRAMLFPYGIPGDYCYWMKDMRFSIDMVWLDNEKRVITIKHDAKPETYPNSFCPERPAQYVIEVNSGVAKANNWQTGTQFSF
jgi:uncharacterized membrane protein (UPF0127 family)